MPCVIQCIAVKADSESKTAAGWNFDNSYARLPGALHARAEPVPVTSPAMAVFNAPLAVRLGLSVEALDGAEGARIFAGNALPSGAEPLAQAYAGHQFGHFTNLGDGRAVLLGEQIAPDGTRWDIQLKGAGQTPFSRRGDGRAALGPMLREYIVSEAMHALGIPTTRSLAVVTTGEGVVREEILPGAVLTRVAGSHIRVGTFEYAAAIGDDGALRALLDHAVARHYPELPAEGGEVPLAFFSAVLERQAELVARWMLVGFIHGVMNTDNMAVSGETIDYGPCAFMDRFDPGTVFSSIDRGGRYAYANQSQIAHWNLARLAESLLPLVDADREAAIARVEPALGVFPARFRHHYETGLLAKIGIGTAEAGDLELARDLLEWMKQAGADFTNTFAGLTRGPEDSEGGLSMDDEKFRSWHTRWRERLQREPEAVRRMHAANPAVIPRNHRVEEALAAAEAGDLSVMGRLMRVLSKPYDHEGADADFRTPPGPEAAGYRTFCGT